MGGNDVVTDALIGEYDASGDGATCYFALNQKGHWSLTSWSQRNYCNYWISLTSIVFLTIDRVEMRWWRWKVGLLMIAGWSQTYQMSLSCQCNVHQNPCFVQDLSDQWISTLILHISLETLWSQRNCYNKHILCSQLQKVLQPQLRWSTKMSFSLWCARLATRWKHLKTKRERCRLPLEVQTCCNLMCICHLYHLYMLYAAGVEAIWQHIFFPSLIAISPP